MLILREYDCAWDRQDVCKDRGKGLVVLLNEMPEEHAEAWKKAPECEVDYKKGEVKNAL